MLNPFTDLPHVVLGFVDLRDGAGERRAWCAMDSDMIGVYTWLIENGKALEFATTEVRR